MENSIEIKQTGYILNNVERFVLFTDEFGNEYKISFVVGGGLLINKANSKISIEPSASNEIRVK